MRESGGRARNAALLSLMPYLTADDAAYHNYFSTSEGTAASCRAAPATAHVLRRYLVPRRAYL